MHKRINVTMAFDFGSNDLLMFSLALLLNSYSDLFSMAPITNGFLQLHIPQDEVTQRTKLQKRETEIRDIFLIIFKSCPNAIECF